MSPYLTLKEFESTYFLLRDPVKILGSTTRSIVETLEKEFSKRKLKVHFGDAQKWPIWIFNHDLNCFLDQREAIIKFSTCAEQINSQDWSDCHNVMTPAFLISGMEIPIYYREKLLPWQNWFLDKIVKKSKSGELTLPWLYLFTFNHFLEAITNIATSESMRYSPQGYNELLFFSETATDRPASLIDPLHVIKKLIATLNILWSYRHSANLVSLRSFVFNGEGLLRGYDLHNRKVTVLAYCGGFIEGKGKCGHSPLVIGQHETCCICQFLICNQCGFCSNNCKNDPARSNPKCNIFTG